MGNGCENAGTLEKRSWRKERLNRFVLGQYSQVLVALGTNSFHSSDPQPATCRTLLNQEYHRQVINNSTERTLHSRISLASDK